MDPFVIWLQQLLSPSVAPVMVFITDWGGPLGWYIAMCAFVIFAGFSRGLPLVVMAVSSLILNTWLKWLFVAPRPYFVDPNVQTHSVVGGFGMPSGHAQGAFAVWGGLGVLLRSKPWCVALFTLALVVALTRTYLGVHSLAQIVVGSTLGLAAIWLTLKYWDQAGAYFKRCTSKQLWLFMGVGAAVCLGINEAILRLQQDFVPPDVWLASYNAATGEAEHIEALGLFANGTPLLIALLCGYLGIALYFRDRMVNLHRGLAKTIAFVLSWAVHFAFISAIVPLMAWPALVFVLMFFQPLVCVYLPMWLAAKWQAGRSPA